MLNEGIDPGYELAREGFLREPIETLGLSDTAIRNLKANQVITIADLVQAKGYELNKLPGVNLFQLCNVANPRLQKLGFEIDFSKE